MCCSTAAEDLTVLSVDEIARLLPHRYPFALLDRVTALVPGVRAEAIKNVSAADPILAGHFPGRMIYPGVLLIECIAQLAAVVYGTAAAQRATGELSPMWPAEWDISRRSGRRSFFARLSRRSGPAPGPGGNSDRPADIGHGTGFGQRQGRHDGALGGDRSGRGRGSGRRRDLAGDDHPPLTIWRRPSRHF